MFEYISLIGRPLLHTFFSAQISTDSATITNLLTFSTVLRYSLPRGKHLETRFREENNYRRCKHDVSFEYQMCRHCVETPSARAALLKASQSYASHSAQRNKISPFFAELILGSAIIFQINSYSRDELWLGAANTLSVALHFAPLWELFSLRLARAWRS